MTDVTVLLFLFICLLISLLFCVVRIMSGFKDEVIVERSRYAWKYAASRGVSGTPAILWNGELLYPDTANTRVPYVEKLAT